MKIPRLLIYYILCILLITVVAGRASIDFDSKACSAIQIASKLQEEKNLFPFIKKVNGRHKYGYISEKGKIIIKPQFYQALPFNDNFAIVKIRHNKSERDSFGTYALIDKSGKIVTKSKNFELFGCLDRGILTKALDEFSIRPTESLVRYYNVNTHKNISGDYKNGSCFKNGLASVLSSNNKYGFINQSGDFKIQPIFTKVMDFSEELSFVTTDKIDGNQFYRIIDINGNYLSNVYSNYDELGSYSEGLVKVKKNEKYGYLDRCGRLVIPHIYDSASNYINGVAIVRINDEYKIIDKTGKVVANINRQANPSKPNFEESLSDFFDNLALVIINKKYGYINRQGIIAIEAKFTYARDFHEGLAWVELNNKKAYIDTKGKIIWQE